MLFICDSGKGQTGVKAVLIAPGWGGWWGAVPLDSGVGGHRPWPWDPGLCFWAWPGGKGRVSLILRGHLNESHARPRKQALQQPAQRFVANAATRDLTQDGLWGDERR